MQNQHESRWHYWDSEQKKLFLRGDWTIGHAAKLSALAASFANTPVCDLSGIERIDTVGFVLCRRIIGLHQPLNPSPVFTRLANFYDTLHPTKESNTQQPPTQHPPSRHSLFGCATLFFHFLGEILLTLAGHLRYPSTLRIREIGKQIEEGGAKALAIIGLSAFLVGVVIAYQVGAQIEKIGANIFVVDMIAISTTRELVPLVVAIIVAGRSGSAYTAQIGTMKITQELDAMRTLGFPPIAFLVVPRLLGLALAMPLLVFYADIVALAGGALIANLQLGVTFSSFIERFYEVFDMHHFWVGLIKSPFFALIIALTGCYCGFQVTGDSRSVGRFTTMSVVIAIFAVICADALFSILFTLIKV
ncbi:MAG: ABC transporter permease [Campylobacterales bacterium]